MVSDLSSPPAPAAAELGTELAGLLWIGDKPVLARLSPDAGGGGNLLTPPGGGGKIPEPLFIFPVRPEPSDPSFFYKSRKQTLLQKLFSIIIKL